MSTLTFTPNVYDPEVVPAGKKYSEEKDVSDLDSGGNE